MIVRTSSGCGASQLPAAFAESSPLLGRRLPGRETSWPAMGGRRALTEGMRRAVFDDAVAVIAAEYASDLPPRVVARRIGTSTRQLQRVFAEVGGTTFSDYLTNVRLDRAAEMLAREPREVAEVARAVGYRSTSAFSV